MVTMKDLATLSETANDENGDNSSSTNGNSDTMEGTRPRGRGITAPISVLDPPSVSSTNDLDSSNRSTTVNEETELKNRLIQEEEKNVRRARCLVGIAIVLCAVAVTVSVYFFARAADQKSFELEYEGYIKDILALVVWEVRYNFALVEQLSAQILIDNNLKGTVFPYHTDPDFEITGGFVDGMGGIMSAAFAPLVKPEQKEQWEAYAWENQGWLERSAYLKQVHPGHRDALHGTIQDHEHDRRRRRRMLTQQAEDENATGTTISPFIYRWEDGVKVPEDNNNTTDYQPNKLFAPLWQTSPADYGAVNVNLLSDVRIEKLFEVMSRRNRAILSENTEIHELFGFLFDPEEEPQKKFPHGFIASPVYNEFKQDLNVTDMVGFIVSVTPFGNLLDRLLPHGVDGIHGIIDDSCGNAMTFELTDGKAEFLGYGDLHDESFDEYERYEVNLERYSDQDLEDEGLCSHDLRLYPSAKLRDRYNTSNPAIYTGVVAMAFVLTAAFMLVYDMMVNRRQNKTMKAAARTQAIVTSLFPKEIGKKLIQDACCEDNSNNHHSRDSQFKRTTTRQQGKALMKSMINEKGEIIYGDEQGMLMSKNSKPLADLFLDCTIMFADIVGFTAWSSTREPSQVFILLENLYSNFDEIAAHRRVFKVETVGDCYVAVSGLPEPRKDHAIVMSRFARDCLHRMGAVLQQLTVQLGPDTNELGMRIGLHSGPVTAGVLRGDRARFQLFGDTVNTTARLESTGSKNMIHISQDTADQLIMAGKGCWIHERDTTVHAKGKGEMRTYWLFIKGDVNRSTTSGGTSEINTTSTHEEKQKDSSNPATDFRRLVSSEKAKTRITDWTTEVLLGFLKEIVAQRMSRRIEPSSPKELASAEKDILLRDGNPMDEVQEVIHLPRYNDGGHFRSDASMVDPESIELDPVVIGQMKDLVLTIASLYNDNAFHNFAHASHVTMSVVKLMKRIVAPDIGDADEKDLHDHTFGITSDPLTQFSVILSALIHDVDHSGVSNSQLIEENAEVAQKFNGKSVAEQNSVSIVWDLLMESSYTELRRTIYTTVEELQRFRQMVVHTVLATDIMDKDCNAKRKARWEATFATSSDSEHECATNQDDVDRKATIVIEHLMQASDVAHTMQHWHVYRKWNAKLFHEMHRAYMEGRSSKDPSENWYDGELGFFDFYIIPLALKLKTCGVFGVSSDEYLNYAQNNRKEWELKGKDIVKELVMEAKGQDALGIIV